MSGEILQSQIAKPKSWISQQWAKYKQSIGYVACFVLLFKGWHILALKYFPLNFILSQIGYFVLGIIHFHLFYIFLSWADKKNLKPLKESLFTLLLVSLAYILVFIHFNKKVLGLGDSSLSWSVIPFIIPFLVMKAWDFWEAIPERLYKTWQYPVGMKPPFIQPQNTLILMMKIDTIKEGEQFLDPNPFQIDIEKTLGDHLHLYLFTRNAKYTGDQTILISDPKTGIPNKWSFITYNFFQRIFGGETVLDFDVPIKNLNLKTGTLVVVLNN